MEGKVRRQVLGKDFDRGLSVRTIDPDLDVESSGPQHRRIDQILPVAGADDNDVLQTLDPVDLGKKLGDDGGFHVRRDPGSPGPKKGIHLIEKDDHGHPLFRLVLRLLEHLPNLALTFPHVLVQKLGALHVEEVTPHVPPLFRLHPFGDGGGDRLGDQGLPASRGAVKKNPLRRTELVFLEEFRIDKGEFHRIHDGLDLILETPDVRVTHVRNLFQDHFLHLRLGKLFEEISGTGIQKEDIPHAEFFRLEGLG